jgi:hypothetical protein
VANLLARAPGVSPDLLDTIVDQSAKRAQANLTVSGGLSPFFNGSARGVCFA